MSDDTPAVWTDYLSNNLMVRRYADGDIVLHIENGWCDSVLVDNMSVQPLIKQIRDRDCDPTPNEVVLSETTLGVQRLHKYNGVLLIENEYEKMPISYDLATELADCIVKNGRYGTPETVCSPYGW
ncbi:hypothetical protein ACFQE1_00200 [Halobium palmae]|uniref:Uncharacterized protein n=1 Tax=Halobium palmae TaxID=1776492 RepID=A0ABD5RUD9_9EURY